MVATETTLLCWCLCLAVGLAKGSYIPADMNRTIQNLLDHYKITPEVWFDGKPVFSKDLPSGNLEAEMIYMGAVLQVYDTLLKKMLEQLPAARPGPAQAPGRREAGDNDKLRTQLSYLQKMVENLRTKHYVKQEQFLEKLEPLSQIQFNNSVTQSKALWEFIKVYEEASSLPDKMERRRRRRRRQTHAIKGHQRA